MSAIPMRNGKRVYEHYSPKISDEDWDVIVIGSGMGGMSCSAALSKLGKKVLLLEQHYVPGGFTHMFGRKGHVWDVGVHVMGEMTEGEIPYKMLKWLTNGEVTMNSLGDPFDSFYFPHGYTFHMPEGSQKLIDSLKAKFPDETEKIDRYVKMVRKADVVSKSFFLFQTFPLWLEKALSKLWYGIFPNYWAMTTEDVIASFNFSKDLKLSLTSHWGYYGSVPKESSFGVHALTHTHFWNGARYPQGGAKVFAESMLANVHNNGGKVLTKASVQEVLVENGTAVGVRMADGREFRSKYVVSAAGAKSTVNWLVPASYRQSDWAKKIQSIGDSPPYLCLNLAFKGDIKAAGARSGNMWLYTIENNDQCMWDIADESQRPHLLYVSFPSLKDPHHDSGPDQMHTGECVTFVDWKEFAKWQHTQFGDREPDYEALKKNIEDRMLIELKLRIPAIMQHLEFCELSTPLTAQHYARASQGAIYGLEASPKRFLCEELRVRTPIKNFYMGGVDVATLGVISGMTSGILAATAIDKRAYLRLL